ncbi:MAG: PD40 domain-containing protein [Candidatus Riflebacteria bacterium]|nr:PD40 domain-containing protein [Candidatus Riflebacteria bacterium]
MIFATFKPGTAPVEAVAAAVLGLLICGCGGWTPGAEVGAAGRPPALSPDYRSVTIPPNIAPLNVRVVEAGTAFHVTLEGEGGGALVVASGDGNVRFPVAPWRELLGRNRGKRLTLRVVTRGADGRATAYSPVRIEVAREEIDPVLVYRFIVPHFNVWNDIRICQRDLTGFTVEPVLRGLQFGNGCTNCHAFSAGSPRSMSIGTRGGRLPGLSSASLVLRDGELRRVKSPWGYTAWHPDGRHAAYSLNRVRQFFHGAGQQVPDVLDLDSEIVVCDVETGQVFTSPAIANPDRLETYPGWSPDGRTLYFSSAPILWTDRHRMIPDRYSEVRYDLCRVAVDLKTRRFGKVETVLSAADAGGSVLIGRVSPDGRWLVSCVCDYGCFPIYRPSSDLHLIDLSTGARRKLEEWSSPESDSYHSWSSNGRWCAFSSKRDTGVFTRTYFGYFGPDGRGAKPFVLPQEDPEFYDSCTRTFTVPELLREPIPVGSRAFGRAARSSAGASLSLPATTLGPGSAATEGASGSSRSGLQ